MMKILLIEKNATVRFTVTRILIKEGYEVVSADNGSQAFELIQSQKFDVILTNIFLKYYSGFEIIHLAKQSALNKDAKVIVISDAFTSDIIKRLCDMEVDDIISKPFLPMELMYRLSKLFD